jgi:copper homeostasis protein
MRERVARVLTSGGSQTALEGVEAIAKLVSRAAGQIAVMAGGGVREETVQEVVHRSKVSEVHVRGTRPMRTEMAGGAPLKLRKPLPADEGAWEETDERRIREFVRLANG